MHDASRLEWSVSIPLPEHGSATYAIDVELEIPANVFARHAPWDQLQSWTRLDGPADTVRVDAAPSIDALRRGAIGFANKLARASEGFSRHCRLAAAVSAAAFTTESLRDGLELWLGFAAATAKDARDRLTVRNKKDSTEIARERGLVDEYVSVRLLEALATAERAIAALRESRNPRLPEYEPALVDVEERLGEMLEQEVAHRDRRSWLHPAPLEPASLEGYIERASRLKKHFQEVLFLEREQYQVAERLLRTAAGQVGDRRVDVGVRVADPAHQPLALERVARWLGPLLRRRVRGAHLRGEGPHQGARSRLDQRQRAPLLRPARRPLACACAAATGARPRGARERELRHERRAQP